MSELGRFIVLEGGEGAGKSTQVSHVEQWLRGRGRDVRRTREPGGSPLAEAIRGVVLGDWDEGVDAQTELLLIFAARAAHLELDGGAEPPTRRDAHRLRLDKHRVGVAACTGGGSSS